MSNISLTKYSKSESLENREFSVPKILDNLIKFSIDQNSTKIEIKIEHWNWKEKKLKIEKLVGLLADLQACLKIPW